MALPTFKNRFERLRFGNSFVPKAEGPLRGGSSSDCLSSVDIDNVLSRFTNINAFPAEFSRMLEQAPETTRKMFCAFQTYPVVIPFHCDFHWIAVIVEDHEIWYADSAPSPSHTAHIDRLVKTIEWWDGKKTLRRIDCPRQPPSSTECGIHLLINAIALVNHEAAPCSDIVSYGSLRNLVSLIGQGLSEPHWLIRKARVLSSFHRSRCFADLSHNKVLQWLDDIADGGEVLSVKALPAFHFETIKPVRRSARGWHNETGALVLTKSLYAVYRDDHALSNHARMVRPLSGGVSASSVLSEAEVSERLRSAQVGDFVRVLWSTAAQSPTCWTGILTKKSGKRFSVTYDLGDSITCGIIPNPEVHYHSVEINPLLMVPFPNLPKEPPAPEALPAPTITEKTKKSAPKNSTPGPSRPAPTQVAPEAPSPVGANSPVLSKNTTSAVARTPPPPTEDTSYGTGCPEIDKLYADVHLAKNAPLPQSLRKLSGEQCTAEELVRVCKQSEATPHPIHRFHLAPSTAKSHRRALRWIAANLSPGPSSVDVALPRVVAERAASRNWAPTTWLTHLNNLHGALACIFLYRKEQLHVSMTNCPNWRNAVKSTQHLKPLHKPNQPKAATEQQVMDAMAKEPRPEVRAAIEVAWLTAARGGDVRQLLAQDFTFPVPKTAGAVPTMVVTFRRGKTAKRDQYSVGAPLPSKATRDFLAQRQMEGSWAFPGMLGKDLMLALRRVDPLLEQRSLRRGRLQHLAHKGWSDDQLIEVSRHASIPMLRRYLDMGVVSATTRTTAERAAMGSASC